MPPGHGSGSISSLRPMSLCAHSRAVMQVPSWSHRSSLGLLLLHQAQRAMSGRKSLNIGSSKEERFVGGGLSPAPSTKTGVYPLQHSFSILQQGAEKKVLPEIVETHRGMDAPTFHLLFKCSQWLCQAVVFPSRGSECCFLQVQGQYQNPHWTAQYGLQSWGSGCAAEK